MRTEERNQPVVTWEQTDEYLAAKVRAEWDYTSRQRRYAGLSEFDSNQMGVADWSACDTHLQRLRSAPHPGGICWMTPRDRGSP
jgi:hypothetical protein